MTATTTKKPARRGPSQEQRIKEWAAKAPGREQAARDEHAIDAADTERQNPFYDQDAADRAQQRYERTILGWTHD